MVIGSPLEPLSNYLLVKVGSTVEATAGGVLLPEKSKEKPTEGVVVAVGPGKAHPETGVVLPMPVSVGEKVMYGKYDGTSVKYCGEDHQLIRDDDILMAWDADTTLTVESARPVRDRVLMKPELAVEETASGIALAPGVAEQQKTSVGKVLKIGDGRLAADGRPVPVPVDIGDFVKYRDYAGIEVKVSGQEYIISRFVDCIAKWK